MEKLNIEVLRNNLKGYRVRKGLTQEDMAEILGVSVSTVKNWEKEPHKMTFEKLALLAQHYGVSVNAFFDA